MLSGLIVQDGCYMIPLGVNRMSLVTFACGSNFFALGADRRKTIFHENAPDTYDDNFTKIFKINDNVVVGAAGYFAGGEGLLDALKDVAYPEHLTLRRTSRLIQRYCRKLDSIPALTNYRKSFVIGGKTEDGRFGYCTISWKDGFNDNYVFPTDGTRAAFMIASHDVAISPIYSIAYTTLIEAAKDMNGIKNAMEETIRNVSSFDASVGSTTDFLTIT